MLGCVVQTLSAISNQKKWKALLLGVAAEDFTEEVDLEENVECGLVGLGQKACVSLSR